MRKICAVYSFRPSSWVSCQKIVSNLLKAYRLNSDAEIVSVQYAESMDDYEMLNSIQQIAQERPDTIVFMDHRPHCVAMLEQLRSVLNEMPKKPTLIFHIYGDFTLHFSLWHRCEAHLKGFDVLWYAASARQRAMLSEFIPLEQIEICPFPVDEEEFFPDEKLRQQYRAQFNWQPSEKVFLFTGRLSRQKRTHQLISEFCKWRREQGASARLVLVGDADKIGEPFLLKGEYEGEYFHYLIELLEELPDADRAAIELHGFRPNQELNAYYNAADVFVNISVHNDEDYGMSCAEALAAGLPLILTDWAGFSSFRRPGLESAVAMVPVKISPKGKLISLKGLNRALTRVSHDLAVFKRAQIRARSLAYTGLANVAKIVKQGLERSFTFSEFTPTLHRASRCEIFQRKHTFVNLKTKTFNDLYLQVYRHYVE